MVSRARSYSSSAMRSASSSPKAPTSRHRRGQIGITGGNDVELGIEHQIQARDRPEQRPEIRLARMTTRAQANSRSTTQMRSQSVPICDDDEHMRSSG